MTGLASSAVTVARTDLRLAVDGTSLAAAWFEPMIGRDGGRPLPASDATPLVLLHEALGAISLWRRFPERLAAATGRRVFAYDREGFGGSAPLRGDRAVGYLELEAEVVLPAVLDAAGIAGKTVLFGHSDGATIALLAAAAAPGRFSGAIALAAHVFVETVCLAGIVAAAHSYRSTDLRERLARHHGEKTDSVFRNWVDVWLSEPFRRWDMRDRLPAIRCPLLVVQGDADEYATLDQVAAIVDGAGGPTESFVIEDCRHSPHLQAEAAVIERTQRFLAACDAYAAAR